MLKGQNILCVSSIDWDFLWQQHQAIMSRLVKNGNRVLFIENTGVRFLRMSDASRIKKRFINWLRSSRGFRKESENLYIYSPLILPFPYSKIARCINKYILSRILNRWTRTMDFYDPIIWTFLPTPIVLDIAEIMPYKAFIYYCTDNFSATSASAKKIIKYEEKVIKKADEVFVMSKNMTRRFSHLTSHITCVPMGVDIDRFMNHASIIARPREIESIKTSIIGYVGGIRDSIDQELVTFLAEHLSNYTFVFVGPVQTDISRIKKLNNITFTGQKSHDELSNYIKYFNACIIPYKKDDYTDNISPAKLNEYLIMGKPVISTKLNEIDNFNKENENILYVADTYQDFLNSTVKAINEDNDAFRSKRNSAASNNSWDKKIEIMSDIIETTIRDKEAEKYSNWQKVLLNMYKKARNKAAGIILSLLLGWFILFHSPTIWLLASPLNISNTPEKADAIVVFGGGVGESGSPGKSTIERARYATELYKNGYAKKIIFSSGYTYTYNDAENMKLFAISMGVYDEDIVLEEHANSTYENVIFSKQILKKNNWEKILLISSLYNMRRAALVFNKFAKEIKVIYTPVKHSQFYDRVEGKRLEQIKAIMHEYLGIIYYWFKGYV